ATSTGSSNHGVLLPDGSSGIDHGELTRLMPEALRRTRIQKLIPRDDKNAQPRKERRKRERLNAPRGTRILVVDDSRTVRLALSEMLKSNHYQVFEADSARAGLEIAAKERLRLIFLDIILPDMTGFRALKRLRALDLSKDTPVIMMSGDSDAAQKVFLKRVGADDFIDKPFGRLEVFGAIERLIRADALRSRIGD
ncbi:MAG: response regulator, partial [Pseudomonadota bacterium]